MQQINVITKTGMSYLLSPVRMKRMPSASATDWVNFQGSHIYGTDLSEEQINKITSFMREHKTEALTDGKENLTIAGGMFAKCFPEKIL
jgi:hypothetical protein